MITPDKIKVKPLKIQLTAKTVKCNYSQVYNLSDVNATNYMPNLETAKQRFMTYYNQYE